MATKSLTFDIYGKDKSASKTIRDIGKEADGLGTRFAGVARGIAMAGAAALAGLAVAGVAFATESVKAYAEAEKAQSRLEDAFKRFPKLADTNIDALRDLNSELAKKTRFDDDAFAVGQSVLAQYDLTGQQLAELTPLLADYASKTGKDLPAAAEDLGKALLGQGRALKNIGVDFVDTGSVAGNFDEIVAALRGQVGGFAEEEGNTAAGKLEILRNRFGEVQEKIGEALMPALQGLMDWIETDGLPGLEAFAAWFTDTGVPAIQEFASWLGGNKDVLGPAALAIGGVTTAVWLLNAAMLANPVTWFALVAVAVIAIWTAVSLFFSEIDAWISKNPWVLLFAPLVGGTAVAALLFNTLTQKAEEVQAAFGRVGDAIRSLPATIVASLGSAAAQMYAVGQNMIRGLTAGILAMASNVAVAAANVVNNAVSAAKAALGIKSPSRVFRDQVGKQVVAGFIEGITGDNARVSAAFDSMLTIPSVASASGAGASSAALVNSSSPAQVFVQNPWTGAYMEARLADTAGRVVLQYEKETSRASSRGSSGF